MKLYEYQGKALFKNFGIPVPEEENVRTVREALSAFDRLGGRGVIKAQVLTGGRGKAGGVKVAESRAEAEEYAGRILGMKIKGIEVRSILVSEAVGISREYYAGITLDRDKNMLALILSGSGGVDIETLADSRPGEIHTVSVNPLHGLEDSRWRDAVKDIFGDSEGAEEIIRRMYALFIEKDCMVVEINPLAEKEDGTLIGLDAKIVLDENGVFRHPDMEELRNREEYGPDELEAREKDLAFISMDGTIGCIVNGAGLAMATMDIIGLFGGSPANFLDVGGSSSPQKVLDAFHIITKNPRVTSILINIFGGITRCDDVARGILQAREEIQLEIPLVIRLIGTNEEEGRSLLRDAGIEVFESLTSAVQAVVLFK